MQRIFEDKVALVTGAGGGIGGAIAIGLAEAGAYTVAADIDLAAVNPVINLMGAARGMALALDVTNPTAITHIVDDIVSRQGRLDILVHAAGRSSRTHVLDISPAEWDDVIKVNLGGAFYCTQAVARVMTKQGGGSIIMISSQLAEVARPKGAPYVASKGGLRSLAQAMAVDLAAFQVRVNCLGPGVTLTPMTRSRYDDPQVRATWEQRIPLGRVAQPQDMVGAALFLASDEAAYITGTSLYVDGGYLAW